MVLIPAIVIGLVIDRFGLRIAHPGSVYFTPPGIDIITTYELRDHLRYTVALGNAFFLQGISVPDLGTNVSIWSLANEFWYYIIFPFLVLAWTTTRGTLARVGQVAIAAVLLWFVGFHIAVLFPVWILGALLAIVPQKLTEAQARKGVLVGLAVLLAVMFGVRLLNLQALLADYLIALATSLFLYFAVQQKAPARESVYKALSAFFSKISYSLYLFHLPLAVFLCSWINNPWQPWKKTPMHLLQYALADLLVLVVVYGLWRLFENNTKFLLRRLESINNFDVRGWLTRLAVLLPCVYFLYKADYGPLITGMALGGIMIISLRSTQMALLAIFAYFILLGDFRRIATTLTGPRALDPLLLVGSGFVIYYAAPLIMRVQLKDPLSKMVMALMAMMIVQIFNPRQGPIAVGISGALFTLVPLLWFWIGRRYGNDRILFLLLFRIVLPLGVLDAVLGISQTFIGFLPWEEAWARSLGTQYLLSHNGHIRSFGFSNSGVEYGTLLLITAALIVGAAVVKRRAYLVLLPIVLTAMVLSAMRGPIVRVVFAGAMIWAMRGKNPRSWIPRLAIGLTLGVGLLSYSASQAADATAQPERTDTYKQSAATVASTRVAQGLAHPFEDKYSTGGSHLQIFLQAVTLGFTNPVGGGLGATALGAGKFGGNQSVGSSEIDISDAFLTLGFLGGFLYIGVIINAMRRLPAYIQGGPPITRLVTVGLLAALLGSWTALGQYATAPLAWFCVGSLVYGLDERAVAKATPKVKAQRITRWAPRRTPQADLGVEQL